MNAAGIGTSRRLIGVASWTALSQLILSVGGTVAIIIIGGPPGNPAEYFAVMGDRALAGFLRDDFVPVMLVFLYLFLIPGLFMTLLSDRFELAVLGSLLSVVGVLLCISSHTGFSFIHLAGLYETAESDAARTAYLAAGEALIADNMWNGSAGFFAGLTLQGGGVLLSIAMLRVPGFGRFTAWAGILANGFDLFQHLVHRQIPTIAQFALYLAGIPYLVWYALLWRDLRRIAKGMPR